ncbi:hypothetical protein [Mycetocola zhujimingii]|uniref:hypothetical protein n=1 Tax=Mycetocola zhujimingii TaxID=2079792 RepID=UPI0018E0C04A|nr:hypothetical protein [Mycetocola zhujimingii]
MNSEPERPAAPERFSEEPATVQVRRSPRYANFMLLGALLGAIVAFVLTLAFPENPDFGRLQVFGFLLLIGVAVGVALFGLLAILLERLVGRKVHSVRADRVEVHVARAEEIDARTDAEKPVSDASTEQHPPQLPPTT